MGGTAMKCQGAVFDLDGVITGTAEIHFRAWKTTFEEYLRGRLGDGADGFRPFTYEDDYVPYVDGKPRYQGVKAFLDSRDISLPQGDPADSSDRETICGIGNRKNEEFQSLVRAGDVPVFASTVKFIKALRKRGVHVGVASSSKNCSYVLKSTGLAGLFETVVDGLVSQELGLSGKPDPDIFLAAADRMRVSAADCMMVEDAYAGVEAGRNGNFALVLGVARNGDRHGLLSHGADVVVSDLCDFSLRELDRWFARGMDDDAWKLSYYGFDPPSERLREALTTVGNGYFGTRGSFEGETIRDEIHYPGTYIAGIFNELATEIHGKTITSNSLVNCPDWTRLEVSVDGDAPLRPLDHEVLEYFQELDIRNAVMSRTVTFRDASGRITTLRSRRFASMARPHIAAIELSVVPRNYSGKISVRATLDGTVINYGVERYRGLNGKHLELVAAGSIDSRTCLGMRTRKSGIEIRMAQQVRLYRDRRAGTGANRIDSDPGVVTEVFEVNAPEGEAFSVEKIVSLHTTAHWDSPDAEGAARKSLEGIARFNSLLDEHRRAWNDLWIRADFSIEGDRFAQRTVRLHIYHLITTANPHNAEFDTGIPARGLHGEAYRGHVFWDEMFITPFYNLHFPEVTRAHLMYRYRRLDQARAIANAEGREGALYPWQSADTGEPETQELHFNPRSGRWDADLSHLQRHINIAIAYDIWQYYYTSDDSEFMNNEGIEMLLEMCRFWSSISRKDDDGRYHISQVMGPDEFHEAYPDAGHTGGFRDNAYTNIMTAWLLHKSIQAYDQLSPGAKDRIRTRINLTNKELHHWADIVRNLALSIDENGIVSQFEGWMDLDELDWNAYRNKYGNIRRLDRILKAEGDTPNRYKLTKQADFLQCYYILRPSQVTNILDMMGYEVGDPIEFMRKNYEYYVQRTSHGSTLSYIVHAAIANYLESHRSDRWRWFLEALKSDIYDTQGGTTLEGIHCGVMAGTIEIILKGFAGLTLFMDRMDLHPQLPDGWRRLRFRIFHSEHLYDMDISSNGVSAARLREGGEWEDVAVTTGGRGFSLELKKIERKPETRPG